MLWSPKNNMNLIGINKLNDEESNVSLSKNNNYEIIKKSGVEYMVDNDDFFVWVKITDGNLIMEDSFADCLAFD